MAYGYDLDGELITAQDDFSSYKFGYNSLGEETVVDNNGTGPTGTTGTPGVPRVVLNSSYDAAGNRTSLSARVGSANDFVNSYVYDASNRQTRVVQQAAATSKHDAADPKLVNFVLTTPTAIRHDRPVQ